MIKRLRICFEMPRTNIPFFPYQLSLIIGDRVELSFIDDFFVYLWSISYLYLLNLQPIRKQAYIFDRLSHAAIFPLIEINRLPASVLQVFLFIVIEEQLAFYLLVFAEIPCRLLD